MRAVRTTTQTDGGCPSLENLPKRASGEQCGKARDFGLGVGTGWRQKKPLTAIQAGAPTGKDCTKHQRCGGGQGRQQDRKTETGFLKCKTPTVMKGVPERGRPSKGGVEKGGEDSSPLEKVVTVGVINKRAKDWKIVLEELSDRKKQAPWRGRNGC